MRAALKKLSKFRVGRGIIHLYFCVIKSKNEKDERTGKNQL